MNNSQNWFNEARFGMFVHWGIYSVAGRCEVVKHLENTPDEEYRRLADKFIPQKGFAEEWVDLARQAGMKYIVLTTKHYDGFALFHSEVSDYTAPKSAAGRDLVEEFVQACRKGGMRIGFYHAIPDLDIGVVTSHISRKQEPELYRRWVHKLHGQVRELLTQYGPIDMLWFDNNARPKAPDRARLIKMIRQLQPAILINNRTGLPCDFDTPEQHLVASRPGRLWEGCITTNKHWGYYADDDIWKSPREIVQSYLTACACSEGNLLLNVGPKADGSIPEPYWPCFKAIGDWLKRNGEAIYGSERAPFGPGAAGVLTAKGSKYYLIVHWWPGERLVLPSVKIPIKSARLLATGQEVGLEWQGERLILTNLPTRSPDPLSTVIVME